MSPVDILVGNYTIIDFELFQLWLNGYTVQDCATILQQQGALQGTGAGYEELISDTRDHVRLFASLEQLLKNPPRVGEQALYQIDLEAQRTLIEKYYQFDDVVVREFLGRKLSTKNRNNLDDVGEKTRVPLRSCRRQFDNVKRVFKTVEEMPGSLEKNIQTHYLVPDELAKKYAAIVFMANHRFETGKKKLLHLTFDDFRYCASHMIANWSYSAAECESHEDMDVDLDRTFLQELRDLKMLTEKECVDEQKNYVLVSLKSSMTRKKLNDIDESFKNLSKAMINIAYGLNHSKETRTFFLDVIEKVITEAACLHCRTLQQECSAMPACCIYQSPFCKGCGSVYANEPYLRRNEGFPPSLQRWRLKPASAEKYAESGDYMGEIHEHFYELLSEALPFLRRNTLESERSDCQMTLQ